MIFDVISNNTEFYRSMCGILCFVWRYVYCYDTCACLFKFCVRSMLTGVCWGSYDVIHRGVYSIDVEFYVSLTAHLITVLVNNQLDAQSFFLYLLIPILYMFRVTKCSSSGQSIVSIRPLVYVAVHSRWPCGMPV